MIPADVPLNKRNTYKKNLNLITKRTGKLFLFAGDQRVEHLHNDFYGKGISKEDTSAKHLFEIASKAKIGCFATQFGLIAKYGKEYPSIPYIVKLNSKTNLVKTKQKDPISKAWFSVKEIIELKKNSRLNIVGIGYTIYLGSEFENEMLIEAAKISYQAHKEGLIVIFWIYPRGKAITNEKDSKLISGAASVGEALNADFVKVSLPEIKGVKKENLLNEVVAAAGKTGVICAGGSQQKIESFLNSIKKQIDLGVRGTAVGRNIHQRSLKEAIGICNAINAIVIHHVDVKEAMRIAKY